MEMQKKVCGGCGVGLAHSPRITVEMKPGLDGQPWWLCIACWCDGIKPERLGLFKDRSAPSSKRTSKKAS